VATVQQLLTSHETFWLDIQAPDDDDYKLLTDTFKFHQPHHRGRQASEPAAEAGWV